MARYGRRTAAGWLAAGLLLLGGCGGDAPAAGGRAREAPLVLEPVALKIGRVGTAAAPIREKATGSFHPQDEVTMAAEVAGRVVEIGPEVADEVRGGAVLARVKRTDYELVRDQRARFLAETLTKLGLESLPEGEVDFEKLPSVERGRLEAESAKAKHDRAVRLNQKTPGTVSTQDLADLRLEWDVAESALRGVRLAARTDLAQARTRAADLAVAAENVKDTDVRAPGAEADRWVVAERRVAVGDYVSVGAVLYRLLDTDPMRLIVRIPERRMAGVVKGRPVSVEIASSKEPVLGVVLRVRPEVDLRTRTHEVEVEVRNPDGRLAVGGFAVVQVDIGEDPSVPVVPRSAVVTFAGVTKVFVPAEGKVAERPVTLGRELGDRIEIVRGLAAGDAIVLDPPSDLVTGTPIAAAASEAPPAPAVPPAKP